MQYITTPKMQPYDAMLVLSIVSSVMVHTHNRLTDTHNLVCIFPVIHVHVLFVAVVILDVRVATIIYTQNVALKPFLFVVPEHLNPVLMQHAAWQQTVQN
jgi:hypothetical protein